jgi:hypothetical protein
MPSLLTPCALRLPPDGSYGVQHGKGEANMPYTSEGKHEHLLWMSLLEALDHIRSVKKSGSVAALSQIKLRIGCQAIPVKWADADGPNDKPNVRKLQRSQLVLSGSGLAPSGRRLRPLLVLRSAVYATWPRTTNQGATPPEANSNASIVSICLAADEKYKEWMSLVEAIEHIRMSQHCDSVEALRQLKREMGDGTVGVQWETSKGLKDRPDPQWLQSSQLLLIGPGVAPDNVCEMYRPLLVQRSAVQKLWPLSDQLCEYSSQTGSPPPTQPDMPLHRPGSENELVRAARELYQQPGPPPNQTKAEQLLMRQFPGTSRDEFIRPLLQRDEFKKLRRPRGNQRKI